MAGPSTRKYFCKQCGKRLRIYEDLGSAFCGDCEPMAKIPAEKLELALHKIREYFRPRRGDPGRREAPPGGAVRSEFDL